MYTLKTEQSFDSAHFLAGYNGKCSNIHGHRWRVVVEIWSDKLVEQGQLRGMVVDFGDIKADLQKITDYYDHALIVEEGSLKETTILALQDEGFRMIIVPFRPTAEHFAKSIYDQIKALGYGVRCVEVYETPNNCASYQE